MSKPLQPSPHGIIDYLVGALLTASPWLFGFADNSYIATYVMTVVGIGTLALSLFTDYPAGAIKIIPFQVHGVIETLGAVFLLASPWLMGYTAIGTATTLAVIVGLAWLAVVAMTNYHYSSHRHRMSH